MAMKRSETGNRIEQAVIVFLVVCLVSTGIIYMPAASGGANSELTTSSGYFATNNSTVQWGPEMRLTNSTSDSTLPSIAVDNSGRIHLVWIEDITRDQLGDSWPGVIYYKSSDDGGINWDNASMFDIYGYGAKLAQLHYNSVTDSLALYIIEYGGRCGRTPYGVVSYSYNYGQTWTSTWGSLVTETNCFILPIARRDTRDMVASTGNHMLFSSFSSGHPVFEGGFGGLYSYDHLNGITIPSIAGGSNNFYAVIPSSQGLNFSVENTETGIHTTPVQITNLTATTTALSADGDNVYLVWSSKLNGSTQLYFKANHDAGTTWSDDMKITDAAGTADHADISTDAGKVNIVWQDHSTGNWQVHYMQLDSAGDVLINDTQLSNSTGDAMYPQIITDSNGYSYVVWQDSRNGKWDVYMRRSPDRDVTPPKIVHEPVETIGATENLTINATVTDNFGVQDVSVRYWGDRTASPSIKEMALTSGDMKNGTWQTEIPASQLHSRGIYYYIQAADSNNAAITPIYHVLVTGCSPHFESIGNYSTGTAGEREINISITDTIGVDNAVLYYSVNGSEYLSVNMSLSAGDSLAGVWSARIPELPAGSNISFYIEAVSGDNTNSTEVFSFVTEKNSNSGLNPDNTNSDNTDTSMSANSTESNSLAAPISSNPLPIIAVVVVLLVIIGALLYRRKGGGREDNREMK